MPSNQGIVNPTFSMEKHPTTSSIVYAPLTTERLTKALISEFLWHYGLFQDTLEKIDSMSDYQILTKLHFTQSQLVILKRKFNIDIV